MNNIEEILKSRDARVENLKKSPYQYLLENDIELYLNGVLTEESFQQCIINASSIWKEWKRNEVESVWKENERRANVFIHKSQYLK